MSLILGVPAGRWKCSGVVICNVSYDYTPRCFVRHFQADALNKVSVSTLLVVSTAYCPCGAKRWRCLSDPQLSHLQIAPRFSPTTKCSRESHKWAGRLAVGRLSGRRARGQSDFCIPRGARAEVQIEPRADAAAEQAQQQNRRDQRQQADATGPRGGEFLIRAETAKTSNVAVSRPRQRIDTNDGSKGRWLPDRAMRACVDQQQEDFLSTCEQQHKREHRHGQQQRGEHLQCQILCSVFTLSSKTLAGCRT